LIRKISVSYLPVLSVAVIVIVPAGCVAILNVSVNVPADDTSISNQSISPYLIKEVDIAKPLPLTVRIFPT
jgi:hypothetical protein